MEAGEGTISVDAFLKGELGGLIKARDQMSATLSSLDTFAEEFMDEINAQHSGGFDAYRVPGLDFFAMSDWDDQRVDRHVARYGPGRGRADDRGGGVTGR